MTVRKARSTAWPNNFRLESDGPGTQLVAAEVLAGLQAAPKWLPSKLFYDARGSELFNAITRTEAYYPTRLERAIFSEHAQHIASAGWSKQDVQWTLFERARQPWGLMKNRGKSKGPRFPEFVDRNDDNAMVPIVREARDLLVVVAGGAGGKSMFLPTAGGQSLAVSKRIETPSL